MKLGDDTVVLAHKVPTGQKNDYGQPTYTTAWYPIERCTFAPTKAQTDETRGVPSINGATLVAQPKWADLIEQADHVIYPPTALSDGSYRGPSWEMVGEVGRWRESAECFLRRRT